MELQDIFIKITQHAFHVIVFREHFLILQHEGKFLPKTLIDAEELSKCIGEGACNLSCC